MAYYRDLREHLKALEEKGKLIRISREINKDTQLHPLMRLQFRGLPAEERKGWLFENVVDSRGKRYSIPVACCVLAASREIYAIGMMCQPQEIWDKWTQAQLHPIEPVMVESGPVQEVIRIGDSLMAHGGLDEFPIPISTPGFDSAPFFTSPYWVTKDPETGIRNVGTYRVHVKAPLRTGLFPASPTQHIARQWRKWKERGQPMPAAIIIGTAPNIGYVSVSKLPYKVDEFAVAGSIAGEPVELVKCKTVDLEVPAHAEIVFEGEVSTDEVEPEAPFGEFSGYMGQREMMPYFTIKCITHRREPIWQDFLSQFPPSESSMIRGVASENAIYKIMREDLGIKEVTEVALHESTGSSGLLVIQLKRSDPPQAWKVLEAFRERGERQKVIVVVDEDIPPRDADAVNWDISFRVQPHRDTKVVTFTGESSMDYSLEPPGVAMKRDLRYEEMPQASKLLIDATRKWDYPPISLPKKEFMEEALRLWKLEGLPDLKLKGPWYGYNLGYWSKEEDEEACLATQGRYYETGEKLAHRRRKI